MKSMRLRRRGKLYKAMVDNDIEMDLHVAVINDCQDKVKNLVLCGADINKKNFNGWTPIHRAVCCFHINMVQYLVSLGANINGLQKFGETLVHRAVLNCHGDMLKLLISVGADVNQQDCVKETALHKAARNNLWIMVSMLLSFNADILRYNNLGQQALDVSKLESKQLLQEAFGKLNCHSLKRPRIEINDNYDK
jgi:ankyrin repeat protein